jgi:hypothetical protein
VGEVDGLALVLCFPTAAIIGVMTYIDPSKTFSIIPMDPFSFFVGNGLA